jgi:hypothetical protein
MAAVMVDLIPLILGSAIVPIQIIIALFLLRGERGVLKATAFVAGMATARIVQGVVFGLIFSSKQDTGDGGGGIITSVLLLMLGVLLWITAIKQYRKEDDPDAPPPKWMKMFDSVTPVKAFGFGTLLILISAKLWAFTLSALATIGAAPLSQAENVITFLLFVLLAGSLMLIPIVTSLIAPAWSKTNLERLGVWLARNNRAIVIVIAVLFGTFFLWRGISGLMG